METKKFINNILLAVTVICIATYFNIFFITYINIPAEEVYIDNIAYSYKITRLKRKIGFFKEEMKTYLENINNNYESPSNFPKENILDYAHNQESLILKCEDKDNNEIIYYIINMKMDKINGPLTEKEFLHNLTDEDLYYLLDWR